MLPSVVPYDELVRRSQYHPDADNVEARWALYEAAENPIDPMTLLYGWAIKHGKGLETPVLDIGGGRHIVHARTLRSWGHAGPITVIDPAIDMQDPMVQISAAPHPVTGNGVVLVPRTFEDTFVPPLSADVVTWIMAAYHAPDVEMALQHAYRTMKNGGMLLMATSGEKNKPLHRVCQKIIGEALHVEPPKPYNARFTTEIAARLLPRYFNVIEEYVQDDEVQISEQSLPLFERSLMSKLSTYRPCPERAELAGAIGKNIRPLLLRMIAEEGSATERIIRSFYACKVKESRGGSGSALIGP